MINGVLVCLAIVFGFLGLVYFIAATVADTIPRLITGSVFLGLMIGLLVIVRLRVRTVVEATIVPSGKINLSQLRCKYCGGALDEKSLKYNPETGSILVKCPYCGATYEIVEEVKW